MELVTMGKVVVPARIENLGDSFLAERGTLPLEVVRQVEVSDTVIGTGATLISVPTGLIQQLGLRGFRTRPARTAAGVLEFGIYTTVRLTVQGSDCTIEVAELPAGCPVLIGQVFLELMDWVVDPVGQRLVGNPEHGGEQMIDLF